MLDISLAIWLAHLEHEIPRRFFIGDNITVLSQTPDLGITQ
jgi:hypothetical protein